MMVIRHGFLMRNSCKNSARGQENQLPLVLWLIWSAALVVLPGVAGEIDVSIKIPTAVAENSTVVMVCNYDLHKMPLYSVKWYKSQREFYRYIPKEMPSKSVFGTLGAKVDFNMSDSHHVVLNNVEPNLAGKYRCEVTTDLPDFTTRTESSYMFVVRLPRGNVTLRTEKPRYASGDTLRANCTAAPANPPANVSFSLNGLPVKPTVLKYVPVTGSIGSGIGGSSNMTDNRSRSVARLELELGSDSFSNGKLRVSCRAQVFQLYKSEASIELEEERPRLASVRGTRESLNQGAESARTNGWFLAFAIANILLASMR